MHTQWQTTMLSIDALFDVLGCHALNENKQKPHTHTCNPQNVIVPKKSPLLLMAIFFSAPVMMSCSTVNGL